MELYVAESFYGINPVMMVLCIIVVFCMVLLAVFWKRVDKGVRCLGAFVIAFLLLIIASQVYMSIDARHKVYDAYHSGDYLIVEGIIEDYSLADEGEPNLPDSFRVNDVDFQVPGFVSAWGYPLKNADGGVLKNGMRVRIYYVPYKFENVIMKIVQVE